LINRAKQSDEYLLKHYHQLDSSTSVNYQDLIKTVKELTDNLSGFFLKKDKIKDDEICQNMNGICYWYFVKKTVLSEKEAKPKEEIKSAQKTIVSKRAGKSRKKSKKEIKREEIKEILPKKEEKKTFVDKTAEDKFFK